MEKQERLLSNCRKIDEKPSNVHTHATIKPFQQSIRGVCDKEGNKSLLLQSPPTKCSCYPKATRDLNLSASPEHKTLAAIM